MFKHPFENDPFAMTYEAYKRIYKKDCIVNWYTEELMGEIGGYGKDVYGFAEFSENEIPRVYINAKAPVENAVELLAHELAHVAVGADKDHGPEWEEAFENIHKEYERIGAELFGN